MSGGMTSDHLLPRALRQAAFEGALRETFTNGRTLTATCLSCGSEVKATIGGALPVGAVLSAGPCRSIPGKGYRHEPGVFYRGERIR